MIFTGDFRKDKKNNKLPLTLINQTLTLTISNFNSVEKRCLFARDILIVKTFMKN